MPVVHALYDSHAEAVRAVGALERHGIGSDAISIISGEPGRPVAEGAEIGTGVGAIAGGAGGLLAALGVVTIPGLGPVLAGGWLVPSMLGFVAGAAAGLVLGGLAGALASAGIPADDAEVYEWSLRRGGSVVTARVRSEDVLVAEHALDEVRRVDVGLRRLEIARGDRPADGSSTG